MNQDMVQISQDMECWCIDLPHLFRKQGSELGLGLNRNANHHARISNSDAVWSSVPWLPARTMVLKSLGQSGINYQQSSKPAGA